MNDHNPDGLTPEQYGAPHYRLLKLGETTEHGDQLCFDIAEGWQVLNVPGFAVAEGYTPYRRATTQPADQSARIAELEATLAQVTQERDEARAKVAQLRNCGEKADNHLEIAEESLERLRAQLAASEADRARSLIIARALAAAVVDDQPGPGEGLCSTTEDIEAYDAWIGRRVQAVKDSEELVRILERTGDAAMQPPHMSTPLTDAIQQEIVGEYFATSIEKTLKLARSLERKLAAAREAIEKGRAYIEARDELDMIAPESRHSIPVREKVGKAWVEYSAALASLENSSPQTTEKPNHQ